MSPWDQFLWQILLLKEQISLLHLLNILCVVLLVITNWYSQFPIVTSRSISLKNLVTAGGNLYNSFVILTNHESVNKFKQVIAPLFLKKFLPKYLSFFKQETITRILSGRNIILSKRKIWPNSRETFKL